ncbi:UNVERIFIED_CONTAM: hypothetical protein Sradi_2876000 [Sesamum radiatum]|uniref:J domain-containing protein n=1 Tax=Sesamum radiatum TaxID=300843 RepID=A0AAW2RY35_SESRA
MESISLCNRNIAAVGISQPLFFSTHSVPTAGYCPFTPKFGKPSLCSSSVGVKCSSGSGKSGDFDEDDERLTTSWAYGVLGLHPQCSSAQVKAAFRTKVKQFHPDLKRGGQDSDIMIRRVIQAYEVPVFVTFTFIGYQMPLGPVTLPHDNIKEMTKKEKVNLFYSMNKPYLGSLHCCRECMDPFDQPECEAFDVFVNEVLCIGKGCPYSCVNRAPHAFKFSSVTGTACAASQGHAEDYQVQLAVGQCPRGCIHYVTPSQRVILEELLDTILNMPYDTSAEAELLYSLIVKAKYENNRYQTPKRNAKVSSKHVDWF